MKNFSKKIKKFLLFLLFVWATLAITRTFYNFSKVYTEERKWVVLAENEKRVKLFGDSYRFIKLVEKNSSLYSNILFISPGGKAFFLSRYYLYPRRITYVKSTAEAEKILKKGRFDYMVVFQTSEKDLNDNNSLSWRIERNPTISFSVFDNSDARLYIYKL